MGVLKQHKWSQDGRGVYPYCGQVGISDMFVLGPSMLAVQPIAGTVSGILPIAASAEGPSAESQTTSPKTQNKDGIQWGPATGIRRLGEVVYMSGSECDSLQVCMNACI